MSELKNELAAKRAERVLCRRCGQELKDPESIERGFGPICWGKEEAAEQEYQDANPED